MSDTNLAENAKDKFRDAKTMATDLTDGVARVAKDTASQFGDATLDMANSAKDKVESEVTRQKSVGADYIESIAQATERAAKEFESDLPQAAHYIHQASEQIQGIADNVRERDVRELIGEVQELARRQPTLFFGGAVLVGFAALRFLKSAAPVPSETQGSRNLREQREG